MGYIDNDWYQEATINGVKMKQRRHGDTSEKRWKNLIEPLMPKGERFLELGSNAGFYLRKAKDMGYKEVIGIEMEDEFVEQARYWEENEPKGVVTIHADLNGYEFSVADVVLLANIIYWLTPEERDELLKLLVMKAVNVIVVGRHRKLKPHKSDCTPESILKMFSKWELVGSKDDGKHVSFLFKNPELCIRNIDEIKLQEPDLKDEYMIPAYRWLLRGYDEPYYDYLEHRGSKEPEITRLLNKKKYIINDILKNGMLKPIKIRNNNEIFDGDHRLLIAKHLGFETVVCRPV